MIMLIFLRGISETNENEREDQLLVFALKLDRYDISHPFVHLKH